MTSSSTNKYIIEVYSWLKKSKTGRLEHPGSNVGLEIKYDPGRTMNPLSRGQMRMEGLNKVDIWACDSQSGCGAENIRTETA